ncbi:MerR family transcriptional regulator [Cereibacter sp. SYSU M97828]|nr:MerR family transcriptional regulator [Cereibacter flavus]
MEKSAEAFRTISEVADILQTPAHVLRFWESRFLQIKPVKRAGGRRYYRPSDVALLSGIRRLLHDDGMTIRGVQKILREQGVRHVASLGGAAEEAAFIEVDEEVHTAEVHPFPTRTAPDGESGWTFAVPPEPVEEPPAPPLTLTDDSEAPPLGMGDASAALRRAERLREGHKSVGPLTAVSAISRLRALPLGSADLGEIHAALTALRGRMTATSR